MATPTRLDSQPIGHAARHAGRAPVGISLSRASRPDYDPRLDAIAHPPQGARTPTINVWNDLQVLRHSGAFERIAGLLIGPTETVQVLDYAPQTLRDVVLDVLGDRAIPVLGNVNLGHAGPNIPLPLGVLAEVDADARTISLIEAAVS
jgi:LD-carboxypeptidase C-terminal domain